MTRKTFNDTEGPICPYCGELNRACDSDGLLYDEGTYEWDCDSCDRTFHVDISIHFYWSAKVLPEQTTEVEGT